MSARPRLSVDFIAAHRRARLLTGLARAVVDRGYCHTRVADIVREAHVARNSFYETFANKEAAARALLEVACPPVAEQLGEVDLDRGIGSLAVEILAASHAGETEQAKAETDEALAVLDQLGEPRLSAVAEQPTDDDPHLCTLPPGRHGLPAEFVTANQRRRLLTAVAAAVADRGYHDTTVAEVTRGAQVSRRTFYEHFDDKPAAASALLADGLSTVDVRSALGHLVVEVIALRVAGHPERAADLRTAAVAVVQDVASSLAEDTEVRHAA